MNKDKAIQLLERLQDPEPYDPMLTKDAYDAIQMAIDALSADGDTISRAKAIEAINDELDKIDHVPQWVFDRLTNRLRELPPAQPEQLSTNLAEVGTDCISRQAVKEILDKNQMPYHVYPYVWDAINALPPAQPERIKGHWIYDGKWSKGDAMGESYGHYWKCDKCGYVEQVSWGECVCNFCPNCGSDNREVTE